jgi:ubiquinone/menaquinone biosynthesis C-methylase UbiE
MPFESERFDAVCFFGVLHHIAENERSNALREALRVAKASGAVVFFEPQTALLEKLWLDDPTHPLAANPTDYLADSSIHERRIEGKLMDIFIYRKPAVNSST